MIFTPDVESRCHFIEHPEPLRDNHDGLLLINPEEMDSHLIVVLM